MENKRCALVVHKVHHFTLSNSLADHIFTYEIMWGARRQHFCDYIWNHYIDLLMLSLSRLFIQQVLYLFSHISDFYLSAYIFTFAFFSIAFCKSFTGSTSWCCLSLPTSSLLKSSSLRHLVTIIITVIECTLISFNGAHTEKGVLAVNMISSSMMYTSLFQFDSNSELQVCVCVYGVNSFRVLRCNEREISPSEQILSMKCAHHPMRNVFGVWIFIS